jgi:hypothetical protein
MSTLKQIKRILSNKELAKQLAAKGLELDKDKMLRFAKDYDKVKRVEKAIFTTWTDLEIKLLVGLMDRDGLLQIGGK